MEINCQEINLVLNLAEKAGNKILEVSTGWSKVKKDIRMAEPLAPQLKKKIKSEVNLQYWKYNGSPHNAPDEGYFCEEHNITISFPINR